MRQESNSLSTNQRGQIAWINNLRTFIVFLVVLIHAGGVYEMSGTWGGFWIVDDPATNNLSGLIFLVLDILMMPLLFLISGYLAPQSLANKSSWRFIWSKFRRLMIPWLVAVLTLIPLYKVIFLASRGLPQESWTTYFHFTNGIWGMNWLWFLPALFCVNLIYLAVAKSGIRMPNLSLRCIVLVVFGAGLLFSIVMDLNGLRGWTKFLFIDFQNERALIYILAFLLGTQFFRKNAFSGKPKLGWLYYSVNATNWIPVMLYIGLLLYPWINPGVYLVSETVHRIVLWTCFHLSLLSLGYVFILTFWRYFDRKGSFSGILNRNSYSIYILHVVVQGSIAWWLLQVAVPSLGKHLILAVTSYVVSCVIVSCYRFVMSKLWKLNNHERANRTSTLPDDIMEHGSGSQAG